ncbi:karyopherin [Reticulomyxa filosa]|uniref:Karyopherin n=1 Tax=Reticulomyxa filosa TaxID=46433 RepID=X6NEV2_RETFI|nr:karyopherin [Reticulomyxa filosa]|eukprot:ETO24516.1 karyopherin [Reticulomyxa filosa]
MKHKSKRVQRSACSGLTQFATYYQQAQNTRLSNFMRFIVETFVHCLGFYRVSISLSLRLYKQTYIYVQNLGRLADVIALMCELWSSEDGGKIVSQPILIDSLIPPLQKLWETFGDQNTCTFPVMDCLTRLIGCVGQSAHFQTHYARTLFHYSLQLACRLNHQQIEFEKVQKQHNVDEEKMDPPNLEYWASSLDMLAGLCEKAQPIFTKITFDDASTKVKLIKMLNCAIKEKNSMVKGSALGLLGHLISHCTNAIEPHVGQLMLQCIDNLRPNCSLACMNASWCIGMGLDKYGAKMNALGEVLFFFFLKILEKLVQILKADKGKVDDEIKSNVAITLSRLAKTFFQEIVRLWDKFAVDWIKALTLFPEDEDKVNAFETLLRIIAEKPKVIVDHQGLPALFAAICSWEKPPQKLRNGFVQTLCLFKKAADDWPSALKSIDDKKLVEQVLEKYNFNFSSSCCFMSSFLFPIGFINFFLYSQWNYFVF